MGVSDEPAGRDRGLLPWVANQAGLTGCPVVAIHAWLDYQPHIAGLSEATWTDPALLMAAGQRPARSAAAVLRELGLECSPASTQASATNGLLGLVHDDDLLVLGSRPGRLIQHLMSQNVVARILRTAPCPVVVIPGDCAPGSRTEIAVGYDETPRAEAALGWAVHQAALQNGSLTVIRAVLDAPLTGRDDDARLSLSDRLQQRAAAAGIDQAQLVDVASAGGIAMALLGGARDSAMLVLGSRSSGRLSQLTGADVAGSVIQRATLPIVVVPSD